MRAGLLNEVLKILKKVTHYDSYGSGVASWEPACGTIYASVSYGNSGFAVNDGESVYSQVVTFKMRYTDEVTEYCRIEWQGRLYRVIGIDRYRSRGEMQVKAELITED